MNNFFILLMLLLAGIAVGLFFFGGLWFTVQKAMHAKIPALWFVCSFVLRIALTLLAFFYLTHGLLPKLLACMAGFILARLVVTRLTKNKKFRLKEEWS